MALMITEWKDYGNPSVEESGRICNNEGHDDYYKMVLMTTEIEWEYVNHLVEEPGEAAERSGCFAIYIK